MHRVPPGIPAFQQEKKMTTRLFARLTVAVALILIPAVSVPLAADSKADKDAQQVVIHLTHFTDNLHAVTMALKLGTGLSEKGADVSMMLDLEGVRLVDARLSNDLRWGGATSVGIYYQMFIDAGGKVLVCSHCAAAAGLTGADLRPGARIAGAKELPDLLLAADKILDY
jgi:predicted peroxiredoxin